MVPRLLLFSFLTLLVALASSRGVDAGPPPTITYIINDTSDLPDKVTNPPNDGICLTVSNKCTQRAAIEQTAKQGAGFQYVLNFSGLTGTGIKTFNPVTAYPPLFLKTTIDGSTSGQNFVEISGESTNSDTISGLIVQGPGSTISNLVINRFPANGIVILGGNTTLEDSYVGLSQNGNLGSANGFRTAGGYGAFITGGPNTVVQGNYFGPNGNTTTGNGGAVQIIGAAGNHTIQENIIGADVEFDEVFLPRGIQIAGGSDSNHVTNNLIGGGTIAGLEITGEGTTGQIIRGNEIGNSGLSAKFENQVGIWIHDGASDNEIGGFEGVGSNADPLTTTRNHISHNIAEGILIQEGGGNIIHGNYIGLNREGTVEMPNGEGGVFISSSFDNRIGGTTAGEGNVISANGNPGGITIEGGLSADNSILGNYIGLDANGSLEKANVDAAIKVQFGPVDTTIGNGTASGRNVVVTAGPGDRAIRLSGGDGSTVKGNYIGTDKTGTVALGSGFGIFVNQSSAAEIGGVGAGEGNLISGNGSAIGIQSGPGSTVFGNLIGTAADGITALPNGGFGVAVIGANAVMIGGTQPGQSNTIAFNASTGVNLVSSIDDVRIEGNSIHDNGGLGIDLGQDGFTDNDAGDSDSGPNGLQNFPELTPNNDGTVTAVLDGPPNTPYTFHYYTNTACDPSGHGEGETFLRRVGFITDENGDASLVSSAPPGLFTATATNESTGETSEFSECVTVPEPSQPTPTPSPTRTPSPTPSPTVVQTPTPTGQTPSPTPTPTPTPSGPTDTPSPTPTAAATLRQGDFNCDGNVDANDLSILLANVALGTPFQGPPPCPAFGDAGPPHWGDVNCDGAIGVEDLLAMLLHLAGLEYTNIDPCTEIGAAFP